MAWKPLGDRAWWLELGDGTGGELLGRVRGMAEAVVAAAIPGVVDVVASPGRVTVAYDLPAVGSLNLLQAALTAAAKGAREAATPDAALHEIPVAYDGPDLDDVCGAHRIERKEFIALHAGADYIVDAIGFLPGFGYLAGLPASLATPRRATPRRLVPAGSVGIGAGQTGVYPFGSPGGWNLVGRSPLPLFDPQRPRPALLSVGDRVRFIAADLEPPPLEVSPEKTTALPPADAAITVLQPGLFTTVQDLGRPGYRAAGVPLSGAADAISLRLGNLLVGNPEDAAGLECTLLGPTLRFEREAIVALTGGSFPGLPSGVATRVRAGSVITLGHATTGCRGYLAVAGGIDVPQVLGSRSTLVAAGLGGLAGKPLAAGARLAVGKPMGRPASRPLPAGACRSKHPSVLGILPGEHTEAISRDSKHSLWSQAFRVTSRSDRMGMRLEGEPLAAAEVGRGMPSAAVFPGTVQMPPDGQPIVLLADAQTIGGYPVLGHVIAADLPEAAQLRPGEEVGWRQVSLEEAHAARHAQEANLAAMREALQ